MKQNRLPIAVSRSLLVTGLLFVVVGLVWFFTPHTVYCCGGGYLIEYPNWRGLPFITLAVVLWTIAGLVLRYEQKRKSQIVVSIGLLIAGFVPMVVGLVWFFTPNILEYGDLFLVEYPNSRGMPFMALSVALWITAVLLALRDRKRQSLSHST